MDKAQRIDRFWEKVVKTEACWIWAGAKSYGGYGQVWWEGRTRQAHRVSAELSGIDVGNLYICHTCDTPSCVNPGHFFLGSQRDNLRDAANKRRMASGHNPERGRRLNEGQVIAIRQSFSNGAMSMQAIANEHGVTRTTVSCIVSRKTWAHI